MNSKTSDQQVPATAAGDATQDVSVLLRTIRSNLSWVHHELNNPLSAISGNAELLLALADMKGLDEDIIAALRDIEEASQHMAESLHKLKVLKEMIPKQQPSSLPEDLSS